jgi:hypothetical protein
MEKFEIKIPSEYFGDKHEILEIKKKGKIKIKGYSKKPNWSSYHVEKTTIQSSLNEVSFERFPVKPNYEVEYGLDPLKEIVRHYLNKNGFRITKIKEIEEEENSKVYEINYTRCDDDTLEVINNIFNLNTLTRLRYPEIKHIDKKLIKVSYAGHEVGGSYVHDYEVAPKYVEDLTFSTNREVNWNGRSSGSIGYDVYNFSIALDNIFNKNKYVPEGKLLRVENTYNAFKNCNGFEWAILYHCYESFLEGLLPEGSSIKVDTSKKYHEIFFGDIRIAKVINYEKKTHHYFKGHNTGYNRTRFHCTFDLLIKKNTLPHLFCEHYQSVVNKIFERIGSELRCKDVYFKNVRFQSERPAILLSSGKEIDMDSNWYLFWDEIAEKWDIRHSPDYVGIHFIHRKKNSTLSSSFEYRAPKKISDIIIDEKLGDTSRIELNYEKITDQSISVKNGDRLEIWADGVQYK